MHDDLQEFHFSVPTSWQALTQPQLRYVLTVLATFQDHQVCKVYLLVRFCRLQVLKETRTGWKCRVRCRDAAPAVSQNPTNKRRKSKSQDRVLYIGADQILSLLHHFDFIDDFTEFHPLQDIRRGEKRLLAVSRLISDVTFIDYLTMEKYYQLFMIDKQDEYLQQLGWLLYRTESGDMDQTVQFQPYELLGIFMWFSSVKAYLAANFPNFFKPAKAGEGGLDRSDIMPAMQAQIRALTDGDITKQQAVYHSLCWDALAELDNKAREAEEFKRQMSKNS